MQKDATSNKKEASIIIFDPRRGHEIPLLFGGKRIPGKEHGWIYLALKKPIFNPCSGDNLTMILKMICKHYKFESFIIQIGPAGWLPKTLIETPSRWHLLFSSKDAALYRVPVREIGAFAQFFDKVARYEIWTFYFHSQQVWDATYSRIQELSMETLLSPMIKWRILVLLDKDIDYLGCILPSDEITDCFLAQLIEDGLADWYHEEEDASKHGWLSWLFKPGRSYGG